MTGNSVELIEEAMQLNTRFPINFSASLGVCYFAMAPMAKWSLRSSRLSKKTPCTAVGLS